MKLMVIGGGGREHAIIKKLKENPAVEEIYCLPGNGGIAADAVCVPEIGAKDIPAQVEFAKAHRIDYAVVAPDDPLALGAVDALTEAGVPCFGPDKKAAVIEASKAFAKNLMQKYNIPTAKYRVFTDAPSACAYIDAEGAPIVVKADGLALGKGVVVAQTVEEAKAAVRAMIEDKNATIFAGFAGGPANTTYGENTALLAITKNYDPRVLELTAVLAIVLSCVGKFGGFLQSIPQAVMGGISIYLFSMITYVGVKSIKDSKCYEGNIKNVIIMATVLIIGLGTSYLSTFAGIEIGIPLSQTSSLTGLSLAAIVGVILNRVLNNSEFKDQEVEVETAIAESK